MSTKTGISDFPIIALTVSRKESILTTGSFGVRFYHINNSMASRHEIKCINKTNRTNAHERIERIGGMNGTGTWWYLTQQEAIAGIEEGQREFYVAQGGAAVNVIVATSAHGNKYIKTENDGEQPNNLLSLPECLLPS
ncbi:DUF3892 domain-containing protein [Parapedobacter deserti]|uniref:DUF3892 domain-containing protein n=1 Tax=Parapedobacter deserti TaxID=1912957 RepID=A0ABV7JPS1_9SPHI